MQKNIEVCALTFSAVTAVRGKGLGATLGMTTGRVELEGAGEEGGGGGGVGGGVRL